MFHESELTMFMFLIFFQNVVEQVLSGMGEIGRNAHVQARSSVSVST